MKKLKSLLVSTLLVLSFFSCKGTLSESDTPDAGLYSSSKAVTTTIVPSEQITDCNVSVTDLGAWQNSVKIPAAKFSNLESGDYVIITTESNWSNDERQLQVLLEKSSNNVTPIGTYGSLSDSNYLGEWKCYTLYNGYQTTKFYPSESEIEGLKTYGLLIKGKGVKVTSVKVRTVEYKEVITEEPDEEETEVVVPAADGIINCQISVTDLGSWQNSVKAEAKYFGTMKAGDYVIITTENNWSNDERQLQVLLEKSSNDVTPIGTYGSLSDTTYLGEWKCYTLYNGNQTTKFYPSESEIEGLKTYGLLIKGKGVKVTSVKVQLPVEETKEPEISEPEEETPETPAEPEEEIPETPADPEPVTPADPEPETPVEPEPETPVENPSENDGIARVVHDCKIGASDLGDAWEWTKKVDIEAFHLADMESGDYIIITTDVSKTSAAGTLPQLKLGSNVNWNLQIIGSAASCTNVQEYNEKWNTYTLNSAKQSTTFKPTDSEVDLINKNGLVIQGQGVTVIQVLVYTRDYSAENPNQNGDSPVAVTSTLSDPYATNNTKHLYNYIKANYGKKVITGQMENAWDNSIKQLDKVYADTGKYPAMMGFDFIDYNVDWAIESGFNVQTERAINFWNGKDYRGRKISNSNGIVTFCWHWKDPMKETTNESYKPEELNFRIPYDLGSDSWKTSTAEYAAMMRDLDYVAAELLRLQEAGVPVIWRPLHEGAGNLGVYNGGTAWFWWGAGTSKSDATNEANCAEAYIALWQMMYKYFTETKGIHNLIWLWNGQNEKFYPGDKYVDMIGDDIYRQKNYNAHKADFDRFQAVNPNLPVALSECGTVPTLENMVNQGAMWSFFMIWNDASNSAGGSDNFWNSENYNPMSHKLEVYNSPYAITLDDVGDLTAY